MGANGTDDTSLQKKRIQFDLSLDGEVHQQKQSDQERLNASIQAYTEKMAQEHAEAEVVRLSQNATLTVVKEDGEEPQPPETVQAPAKSVSMMRKMSTGLPLHIPSSAAEPIEEYHFYDQKVSSMWKARGTAKTSPDSIAARMKRHVDRFICSSEITETNVSQMASVVFSSGELFEDKKAGKLKVKKDNGDDPTNTAGKFMLLDILQKDDEGAAVDLVLKDYRNLLTDPTGNELPWEDPYYLQHPAAARTIMMLNILQNIDLKQIETKGFRSDSRLETRINGLIDNLKPLCEVIRNSEDYSKALEKFTGAKTDAQRFTGDLKTKYEKGVIERVERLGKAMDDWSHYKDINALDNTQSVLSKYLKTLELYEEDLKAYSGLSDGVTEELKRKVDYHLRELEVLREYSEIADKTDEASVEKRRLIEQSLGFATKRRQIQDKFGKKLDARLKELEKEPGKDYEETEEEIKANYPPEVIESVKRIDQWLASTVMKTGQANTEGNFSSDILNKTFSQRLVAYYMIEKGKRKEPSTDSIVIALNDYVPNYAKFKKAISASKAKFWLRGGDLAKSWAPLRHTKFISRAAGTTGHLYLAKVEDTLKTLNDSKLGFAETIEKARKEKMEAANAEAEPILKDRHEKYVKTMKLLDAYRVAIASHKKFRNTYTKKKLQKAFDESRAAFEEMNTANKVLANVYKSKGIDQPETFDEKELRRIKKQPEKTQRQKNDETRANVEKASTFIGSAPGKVVDQEKNLRKYGVWDLSLMDKGYMTFCGGLLTSCAALTQFMNAIVSIATIKERADAEGASGAIEQVFDSIAKLHATAQSLTKGIVMMKDMSEIVSTAAKNSETVGKTIGKIPVVKGFAAAGTSIKIANDVREVITVGVNDHRQKNGWERFAKYDRSIDRSQLSEEEQKKLDKKTEIVRNTRKIQEKANKRRMEQAGISAINNTISLVGSFIPGASTATTIITSAISFGASIKKFYDKMNEADSAIDDFIHMDELVEEYKKEFGNDDEELQKQADEVLTIRKEQRRDSVFRDMIRQAVLQKMGYTSYAEMFESITEDYCNAVHKMIFYKDDGETPIFKGDKEADPTNAENEGRFALMELFAPLKFVFPEKNDLGRIVKSGRPAAKVMKKAMMK